MYSFFKRESVRNGKKEVETIGYQVKGLKLKLKQKPTTSSPYVDTTDGTKLVKIEGCEYRVTKEQITDWLELSTIKFF